MSRRIPFVLSLLAAISVFSFVADAKEKAPKRAPVIGVITDGVAEKLYGAPKLNREVLVGKTLSAICDGGATAWKLSEVGAKGELKGSFVSGSKAKHCLLLSFHREGAHADKDTKARPTPRASSLRTRRPPRSSRSRRRRATRRRTSMSSCSTTA